MSPTAKCPNCDRKLSPLPSYRVATTVHDRKCRGCGARWRLIVRPKYGATLKVMPAADTDPALDLGAERRWRRVANLDLAWSYEEKDPKFRPRFTKREGETNVRGWRPLACVWKAYLDEPSDPDAAARLKARGTGYETSKTPWRATLAHEGPKGPRRDFTTLAEAMIDVTTRLSRVRS